MKIPASAPSHPNSDQMIQWLSSVGYYGTKPIISYQTWTEGLWDAYADTPKYDVYSAPENKWYRDVPIPDGAKQSDDSDGLLGIIDWDNRKYYDFWRFRYEGGMYQVSDGHVYDLDSDGVAPDRVWTCGGSSIPFLAIAIRDEEIERGYIDHPLGCSITYPRKGFKVYPPAATTDGKTNYAYAIPEGARIQLDPNLDLDSLGLSRTAKIVAKAMQEYGIVVKECGGSFAIYAESTESADWAQWGMSGNLLSSVPAQWRIIDYSALNAVEQTYP